jgi:molybdopterin-guanine dinucleotide biosynthesis protein
MKIGAIFGTTLCGKTTLAVELSRQYYKQKKIRTLALDPHRADWGAQAWATQNEEEFWRVVWARTGHLVIVEDASLTINRDRDLMQVFTQIRHNKHRLLVVGHSGSDLLPGMRKQLDTLFLFQQDADSVKDWKKIFPKGGVERALSLEKYEFLEVHCFERSEPKRLTV